MTKPIFACNFRVKKDNQRFWIVFERYFYVIEKFTRDGKTRKDKKNLQYYKLTASGLPKNPPTSAPTNDIPDNPSESNIGTDDFKCPHSAPLSPVQMAPHRCDPAKKARERTNGREFGSRVK